MKVFTYVLLVTIAALTCVHQFHVFGDSTLVNDRLGAALSFCGMLGTIFGVQLVGAKAPDGGK